MNGGSSSDADALMLLKPNSVEILKTLIKNQYTTQELSEKTGIAIATCYRIIKELNGAKLVYIADTRLLNNAYTNVYRSVKSRYTIQITHANVILK